ncbi:MAG: hypothetical protein AAF657_13530 [Acidobacteriota bacterium]
MIRKIAITLVLSLLAVSFALPATAAPCCQDCDDDDFSCLRWCVYCLDSEALLDLDWQDAEPLSSTPADDLCVELVTSDLESPVTSAEDESSVG